MDSIYLFTYWFDRFICLDSICLIYLLVILPFTLLKKNNKNLENDYAYLIIYLNFGAPKISMFFRLPPKTASGNAYSWARALHAYKILEGFIEIEYFYRIFFPINFYRKYTKNTIPRSHFRFGIPGQFFQTISYKSWSD